MKFKDDQFNIWKDKRDIRNIPQTTGTDLSLTDSDVWMTVAGQNRSSVLDVLLGDKRAEH
jgi:hypothetical protein